MRSQTEIIIAKLIDMVERGRLSPGDVLEEKQLCAKFGVSRTPVREALLRLEAIGLLHRKLRGGAVIFRPTIEQFLAIMEVHAKLEGQAAGLAARRIDAKRGKELEQAVKDCEKHYAAHGERLPDTYYQRNLAFHKCVASAAANDVLYEMIAGNARKIMAYYRARYAYKGSIPRSATEHKAIAAAILGRDADKAEDLMAAHVKFDSVTAMDLIAMLQQPRR
jgi:DNA-binding GntR family transcriptional regulator